MRWFDARASARGSVAAIGCLLVISITTTVFLTLWAAQTTWLTAKCSAPIVTLSKPGEWTFRLSPNQTVSAPGIPAHIHLEVGPSLVADAPAGEKE